MRNLLLAFGLPEHAERDANPAKSPRGAEVNHIG